MTDDDWTERAACRGLARGMPVGPFDLPDLEEGRKATREQIAELEYAARICLRCPVRDACLDYAREHNACGVWGGQLLRPQTPGSAPAQRDAQPIDLLARIEAHDLRKQRTAATRPRPNHKGNQ